MYIKSFSYPHNSLYSQIQEYPKIIFLNALKESRKGLVPMGRVELPRIAPYAPQAHVSTSSTTSAFLLKGF